MNWQPIDTAPKDGQIFLAAYESTFGSPVGPMQWLWINEKKNQGRFHSHAIGTESKKAVGWVPMLDTPKGEKNESVYTED